MNKQSNTIKIKIEPDWLKSGYFVYACRILYNDRTYLYFGQTGDNYHASARGPFYRISGHLDKTQSSDQNQIIKGIRKHILKEQKECLQALENVLIESEIEYFYWKVDDFIFNSENSAHDEKRKKTQFIEHWLVWYLKNNKNVVLFNQDVVNEVPDSKKKFFTSQKIVELKEFAKQYLTELGYE